MDIPVAVVGTRREGGSLDRRGEGMHLLGVVEGRPSARPIHVSWASRGSTCRCDGCRWSRSQTTAELVTLDPFSSGLGTRLFAVLGTR